jgi:hypothetical protein
VKRIIFASSNHTVGFYRNTDYIDATAPTRPDSFYGVSKCFGEQLASYYWDRTGRNGVPAHRLFVPEPVDRRMMVTWLSYDDLEEALRRSLFATRVGFTILFGMSNNDVAWWDNSKARTSATSQRQLVVRRQVPGQRRLPGQERFRSPITAAPSRWPKCATRTRALPSARLSTP